VQAAKNSGVRKNAWCAKPVWPPDCQRCAMSYANLAVDDQEEVVLSDPIKT
jgi:hypothetical protein